MAADNKSSGDVRQSALWGTSHRGGEHRSSALWGRGGRGAVISLFAAFVLTAPIAAFAGGGGKHAGGVQGDGVADSTYVPSGLWNEAKQNGSKKIRVIIQSVGGGVGSAESAFTNAEQGGNATGDRISRRLNLVNGVAVEI